MRIESSPETQILIFPQAVVLPANTLRFYLHFSRPAEAHFDRDHLWLLNDQDEVVPDPFLVLSQELWSVDGHRLTVFMEPGRIKRGMGDDPTHEPAFMVGRTYSLVVTAYGHTARRTFRVADPVLEAVDESKWRLDAPTEGSLDPAVVHFDRVMDTSLSEGELAVVNSTGELVRTRVSLSPDGTSAHLIPRLPWVAGTYRLVASARLEDVCGNRLGEALDHDVDSAGSPRTGAITFKTRSVTALSSCQATR